MKQQITTGDTKSAHILSQGKEGVFIRDFRVDIPLDDLKGLLQ